MMPKVDENTKARLALLGLPNLGPARARWLLGSSEPESVLALLRKGALPRNVESPPPGVSLRLISEWASAARNLDLDQLTAAQTQGSSRILSPSDPAWPFHDEPDPPLLLFYIGRLELLESPVTVAVVGTRRCTSVGRTVAYEFGAEFAEAGVGVVSGLALGIDGAAHKGCLARGGDAIGVVGTGLDVVYPGANRSLWAEVAGEGLLVSEALAGTKPQRWRFPARNRLIAALSTAVVVVESHDKGGSLLTVDECLERDRTVFAVPGAVTSPASDGVNKLLVDGATPARCASDVLGSLDTHLLAAHPRVGAPGLGHPIPNPDQSSPIAQMILNETATGPVHIDTLIHVTGGSPAQVVAEVQILAAAGAVDVDGSTVSLKTSE